jgi:fumarate reductase subunit D
MMAPALKHRAGLLWIAAALHRISGLALAIFLPLHFFVLSLAVHGGARLDAFLRFGDQPLVKVAEGVLIVLLTLHLLGGLRLLWIENLGWRPGQKQLAAIAAAVSVGIGFLFLARVL